MSLKSLASLGRVSKTVEINKELTITLHTVSSGDQEKVLLQIPAEGDGTAKYASIQRATLVYATDEINGQKFDDSNRAELQEFYSTIQYSLLAQIFEVNLSCLAEQNTILEDLKKK